MIPPTPNPLWGEYYLPLKPKQDALRRKRPLRSVPFSRMCVFLLSRLSLVAVNKVFYCWVLSAIADTVSVQGVPVPGPNPQTNSREGQGQPLPQLSLGIKAEGVLPHRQVVIPPGFMTVGFLSEWRDDRHTFHTRVKWRSRGKEMETAQSDTVN